MAHLDHGVVSSLLRYEPSTGKLFWITRSRELFPTDKSWLWWNKRFANAEAFTATKNNGYKQGLIFGRNYSAHRLIWFIETGEWPPLGVDHINGDRGDNRWVNLRCVTQLENLHNQRRRRNNTSGINGVSWCKKTKTWRAEIQVCGRKILLGRFERLEDARLEREAADVRFGFSPRHGKSFGGERDS